MGGIKQTQLQWGLLLQRKPVAIGDGDGMGAGELNHHVINKLRAPSALETGHDQTTLESFTEQIFQGKTMKLCENKYFL